MQKQDEFEMQETKVKIVTGDEKGKEKEKKSSTITAAQPSQFGTLLRSNTQPYVKVSQVEHIIKTNERVDASSVLVRPRFRRLLRRFAITEECPSRPSCGLPCASVAFSPE